MRIQLIQQKVPLNSQVTFTLTNDEKISGVLAEIGVDYVTLDGGRTILVDAISMFDVQTQDELPDPINEQAFKKLSEIENRFDTDVKISTIKLDPPDLTFPAKELPGWNEKPFTSVSVSSVWVRIKNKYEYARKNNELSPKFGRIQPIIHELKPLVESFPGSPTLKRALGYFHSISENWDVALQNYQWAAVQSEEADDWFDLAALALKLNKKDLACYSLGKFFYKVSLMNEPNTWFVYVNLLKRFKNLPVFCELCNMKEHNIGEEEIKFLLETAIYLLKKTGAETLAVEFVKKWISGELPKSLLHEVCQKLDGPPTESYHLFLAELNNTIIAFQKRQTALKEKQAPVNPQQIRVGPSRENLYREAERANQSGDLESAERLYKECIEQDIRRDSAIRDLSMVLVRLGKRGEAADILEAHRQDLSKRQNVTDKHKQALDNLLVTVYQHVGRYQKVIPLLENALEQAQNDEKRAQILNQIANAYIRLGNYSDAETRYGRSLKLRPDNIAVQRNLAFCFSMQKRYSDAEKILNQIQNTSPNAKTAELLEAIVNAKTTGEFVLDNDDFIAAPSDFSGELSEFAQFFLRRCEFEGLRSNVIERRVRDGKYIGSEQEVQHDIERLRKVASELGPSSPRERSNYNLSASRIYFDVDNQDSFYQALCRSFASRGDAAVIESRDLDTVRGWYCEALTVYDGARIHRNNDGTGSLAQDADGSLVRYLYSVLGVDRIPRPPKIPSIDQAVSDAIQADHEKAFDAIAYLVSHSGYAADKILGYLYENLSLRTKSLDYLKSKRGVIPRSLNGQNDFIRLWNELRHSQFSKARTISSCLRVLRKFELSAAWLEDNIRHIGNIRSNLFFELDKERVAELKKILDTALELCKQKVFAEQEYRCKLLDDYCGDILDQIENNPTKLSVEEVYPIIDTIHKQVKDHLETLYETLKPQLTLRLADGKKSYVPREEEVSGEIKYKIDVQIVVENEVGRMPADALKLITQPDAAFVEGTVPDIIELTESLRGGKEAQAIREVVLTLTDEALQSKAFSLPVYAEYGLRGGAREKTPPENLSILLDSEFERIDPNPYAPYAGGNAVGDPDMFFGREELINDIAHAIQESLFQSKCVLVYGQYRSGKSSVLYHLNTELQKAKDLLVLNLGNIKLALDTNSSVPILYQILMCILRGLKDAVTEQIDSEFVTLTSFIPDAREFYEHPTPLQFFEDVFKELKQTFKQKNWGDVRVVLLIDEFQYIYDLIVTGELTASFMQDWKALLQGNHFSAVLVGQDVMPKFKGKFANEFGTTQDKRVTYLAREDADKLIQEPIYLDNERDKSRYREQSVQRIIELTAGSPYYIQIICDRLVRYMNRKCAPLVTEADVEQIKESLIQGPEALDETKFHSFVKSGDISKDAISEDDAKKVLTTIAKNSGTDSKGCPRHSIVCDTNLEVDKILKDLVRREVVERDDEESYKICVGLFKEWLIANA